MKTNFIAPVVLVSLLAWPIIAGEVNTPGKTDPPNCTENCTTATTTSTTTSPTLSTSLTVLVTELAISLITVK